MELAQSTPPATNPGTPKVVNNLKPTTENDTTDSYGSRVYILRWL